MQIHVTDDSFDADAIVAAIRRADWPGDAVVLKERPDGTVCRRTLGGQYELLQFAGVGLV